MTNTKQQLTPQHLISARTHLGHLASKTNAQFLPYTYTKKQGIQIINITITLQNIPKTAQAIAKIIQNGEKILFVGTKKLVKTKLKQLATRLGMPYVNEKWLPGMLTNFATIRKLTKKLAKLTLIMDSPTYQNMTKRERLILLRKKEKLNKVLEGISTITKIPSAIFVIDVKKELTCLREAKKLSITTMGIIDSDSSPNYLDYPIPGNDDALSSIDAIMDPLVEQIEEIQKQNPTPQKTPKAQPTKKEETQGTPKPQKPTEPANQTTMKNNLVKLRKLTQAGLLDCKKALENASGDLEKAIEWLRKKGQKIVAKRVNRMLEQGAVFGKTNKENNFGVLLLLACESDFVARNELFENLANTLLHTALDNQITQLQDLLKAKKDEKTLQELISQTSATLGEKIEISQYQTIQSNLVNVYIHTGNRLGSLVGLNSSKPSYIQLAKNIAMHIVANDPLAIDEKTLDTETLTKEKNLIHELLKKEGKPDNIIQKITQNKLQKFIEENTLLSQSYMHAEDQKVAEYLTTIDPNLKITHFKRILVST